MQELGSKPSYSESTGLHPSLHALRVGRDLLVLPSYSGRNLYVFTYVLGRETEATHKLVMSVLQ